VYLQEKDGEEMRRIPFASLRCRATIVGVMAFCCASVPGRCDAGTETYPMAAKHQAVFDAPSQKVPTNTVVDGPILGNGDMGVVISGAPEAQRFWISKCDFWKAKPGNHQGGGPKVVGGLDIHIPALKGAAYHAEQTLYEPEVRSTFSTADGLVEIRSWVAASEDLLVIQLCASRKAVDVEAKLWVQTGDDSSTMHSTSKELQWITRSYVGAGLAWPSTAALAMRCLQADLDTFTLQPGHPITLLAAMRTNHDTENYLDDARKRVEQLSALDIESIRTAHVRWWHDFWSKSFIEIPDKLIEKLWYGSQYIMASCSRNEHFPPGLYGNWITNDTPAWAGDYHLNYNFQAPWWGCFSSNHIELAEPYDAPLLAFMSRGRFYAKRDIDGRGIYYPVGIGPQGLETTVNPSDYKYEAPTSEQGRDCVVQNPWPGQEVAIYRSSNKVTTAGGDRFTLKTQAGETLALARSANIAEE
jgi:alpha-L-fucosidase 2